MKSIFILIACLAIQFTYLSAMLRDGFVLQEGVAQYKGSDYANVVQVARQVSIEEAFDIAESNPEIDYFVYTRGWMMVLEIPSDVSFSRFQDPFGLVTYANFIYDSGEPGVGYCRIFRHGDAVFFKKEGMRLGSAPGLADAYFKR